jgi:hypothetical protein
MASQQESDVVALVRKLVEGGKTFSISIEDPDGPVIKGLRRGGVNFSPCPDPEPCSGNCVKCVSIPGCGLYCVERKDG